MMVYNKEGRQIFVILYKKYDVILNRMTKGSMSWTVILAAEGDVP